MADRAIYACLLKGQGRFSSTETTCAKCGAAIVYDPIAFHIAKEQNPNLDLELWCLSCTPASLVGDLSLARKAWRAHPLIGPVEHLISDDWIRTELAKKTGH